MLNITNLQRQTQTQWQFEIDGQEMLIEFDLESSHYDVYIYSKATGGYESVAPDLAIQIMEELNIDDDAIADWEE